MMASKEKIRVDGIVLPGFKPLLQDANQRLRDIENLPMRKDDVLISSYPKSGNHWLNEIVPRLLQGTVESSHRLIYTFLEFVPDLQDLKSVPSPRVVTSHLPYRFLPKEHTQNNGKIIHIIRNPKDVAVSAFHHYITDPNTKNYVPADWSVFLDEFLHGEYFYGSWFEREKEWEEAALQQPENILVLYYEDLKRNGLETLTRISSFLGLSSDPTFLQAVYDECSFDEVQKRRKGTDDEFIFRKGSVGDWKSLFTVDQREKFDLIFEENMKDSKLKIQYSG
ncbi:sulfotransferase 2A8-like [Saccostrea echinata]|uniref:sulfotransferase 2A8-like n=1 Tax=Saccostrea echinata TaxID=191078 RepID=UPI002A82AD1A|nr:sulfotransferase 2A8-like [Saccostrea echinata]